MLSPSDAIGLIVFIGALVVVYGTAVYIVSSRALTAVRAKGSDAAARPWKAWQVGTLALAALGSGMIAYGFMIEPYWLEITHVKVASSKLHGDRPIRIVHISDLHCDPEPRLEQRLPDAVAAQQPDVIVFTGDSINSKAALPVFRRCMKKLSAIAPTYVVEGNHDSRCWSDLELFNGIKNLKMLNGESAKVNVNGQTIYLAGVNFDSEPLIHAALNTIPSDAFKLFIYHSPDLIYDLAKHQIDLCCVGHTHGGQVRLPFYGAVVTRSKFGKQFEAGLYQVASTLMYVNRGIGMEGGVDPRVRFLTRPEITVIDLSSKAAVKVATKPVRYATN